MITDIKVAEKALVYMLDVHIWTARRKLTAEDFGDAILRLLYFF